MPDALAGIRVYDASMGVAGPYCTSLLALYGAEVIKIEPPEGDWGRHIGQTFDGLGAYFLTYNRGKKSVVLDLRKEPDKKLALELMATCDVVVESFRPGVMKRLGLDHEVAKKLRPDLTYVSISGYGQDGPGKDDAALDTVMQAFSGWMHLNRDASNVPVLMNHISIDALTGLYAFQSVLIALMRSQRSGRGELIDVSLLNSAVSFLAPRLIEHVMSEGKMQDAVTPPTGVWLVKDGSVAISVKGQSQFDTLCLAFGVPRISEDSRFVTRDLRMQHRAELHEELGPLFLAKTADEVVELMKRAKLAAGKVNDFDSLLRHPQVDHLDLVTEQHHPGFGHVPLVRHPGLQALGQLNPAPRLGEHTDSIFSSLASHAPRALEVRQ